MKAEAAGTLAQVMTGLIIAMVLEARWNTQQLLARIKDLADDSPPDRSTRNAQLRAARRIYATIMYSAFGSSILALPLCLRSVIYDVRLHGFAMGLTVTALALQIFFVAIGPVIGLGAGLTQPDYAITRSRLRVAAVVVVSALLLFAAAVLILSVQQL